MTDPIRDLSLVLATDGKCPPSRGPSWEGCKARRLEEERFSFQGPTNTTEACVDCWCEWSTGGSPEPDSPHW